MSIARSCQVDLPDFESVDEDILDNETPTEEESLVQRSVSSHQEDVVIHKVQVGVSPFFMHSSSTILVI